MTFGLVRTNSGVTMPRSGLSGDVPPHFPPKTGTLAPQTAPTFSARSKRSYADCFLPSPPAAPAAISSRLASTPSCSITAPLAATLVPDFSSTPENKLWLRSCLMGEVKNFKLVQNLQAVIEHDGIGSCRVCRLGGRCILLICSDEVERNRLLQRCKPWFLEWMAWIEPWDDSKLSSKRLVWIRCYGIPLSVWNENIFRELGTRWGSVLEVCTSTITKAVLDFGRILVSTSLFDFILETIEIRVDGVTHRIRWIEELEGGFPAISSRPANWSESSLSDFFSDDDEGLSVESTSNDSSDTIKIEQYISENFRDVVDCNNLSLDMEVAGISPPLPLQQLPGTELEAGAICVGDEIGVDGEVDFDPCYGGGVHGGDGDIAPCFVNGVMDIADPVCGGVHGGEAQEVAGVRLLVLREAEILKAIVPWEDTRLDSINALEVTLSLPNGICFNPSGSLCHALTSASIPGPSNRIIDFNFFNLEIVLPFDSVPDVNCGNQLAHPLEPDPPGIRKVKMNRKRVRKNVVSNCVRKIKVLKWLEEIIALDDEAEDVKTYGRLLGIE